MTHVLVKWDIVIYQLCDVSFSESELQNISTFFFFLLQQCMTSLTPTCRLRGSFHQLLFKFAQHFEYLPSKGVAALSLQLILSLFSPYFLLLLLLGSSSVYLFFLSWHLQPFQFGIA